MTVNIDTRFNISDTGYFLDNNHEITKDIVREINVSHDTYIGWYDDLQKTCTRIKYILRVDGVQNSESIFEDRLFKDPNEIVAVLNDQIERGDFE